MIPTTAKRLDVETHLASEAFCSARCARAYFLGEQVVDDDEIVEMYESGLSVSAIAKQVGSSAPAVSSRLGLLGVERRPSGRKKAAA